MRNRVYFSVCGEGLGHATRCVAVAEELKKMGCDVIFGSYGYVYEYLKSLRKFKVKNIPRELFLVGSNGSVSFTKSFFNTFGKSIVKYSSIIRKEKEIIEKYKVNVTVCDGRFSPIVASGFYLGLPTIYITNQTSVSEGLLKNGLQKFFYKKPLDILAKASSLLCDEIIIPDFPPPFTICGLLLSKDKRVKKKLTFSGPLIREGIETAEPIKLKKPSVLVVTGGHSYRKNVIEVIKKASILNKDINFVVVSRCIDKKVKMDNLLLLPFVRNIFSYIKSVDVVVTHAGHSTIMDTIACQKNSVLIPDKNQPEQYANAKKAEKLKVSVLIDQDKLTPKRLINKINMLLHEEKYKREVKKLSRLCKRMRGKEMVAKRIVNYSQRMLVKW